MEYHLQDCVLLMLFWKIRYHTPFVFLFAVPVWIFVFKLIGPHSRTLPAEVFEMRTGSWRPLCSVTQYLVLCLKEDVCIPLSVWLQLLFSDSLGLADSWCWLLPAAASSGDITPLGPSDVRVKGSSDSRSHALTELCLLCFCVSYFFPQIRIPGVTVTVTQQQSNIPSPQNLS